MIIRCLLDGLLLHATVGHQPPGLIAYDGIEPFALDALEAIYYEVVTATGSELLNLERARYRLLRRADDFEAAAE